jgi:zinc transport system permease protein
MLDATLSLIYSLVPIEMLEPRFMRLALVGLLLLAPTAATVGVHVVNHRLSFFSDAIGHSAFTGVALGLLFSFPPHFTMPLFGVCVGLFIMHLQRNGKLSTDAAIGVVFSGIVAFGLAVVSREPSLTRSLQQFLYGDILTIQGDDISILLTLSLANAVIQIVGYNSLLLAGVSSTLARAQGVRVVVWQYVLSILLSLVVIFSVWAVGVLLVTALLVVPAAAARNFARSAGATFWWALVIGTTSAIGGLFVSAQDWARTATGATVVLCSLVWFALSFIKLEFRIRRMHG